MAGEKQIVLYGCHLERRFSAHLFNNFTAMPVGPQRPAPRLAGGGRIRGGTVDVGDDEKE